MQEIDVADWETFENQLNEIRRVEASGGRTARFLFRGVTDSYWPLATTLERRAGGAGMRVSDYYKVISLAQPEIESFTEKVWEIEQWPEVEELLRKRDDWYFRTFPEPRAFSYMVFLRHHGFPSPLLDWTRSSYISAYFAFRSDIKPVRDKVSIYVFLERPDGWKVGSSADPAIRRMGEHVRTHPRHFLQQSDYTMCVIFGSEWSFAKHEDVFARNDPRQDLLWKFNIPWTERLKVLKMLDGYNLNAFSLFDSTETLMETVGLRRLEF
jgi:hypothetical protein